MAASVWSSDSVHGHERAHGKLDLIPALVGFLLGNWFPCSCWMRSYLICILIQSSRKVQRADWKKSTMLVLAGPSTITGGNGSGRCVCRYFKSPERDYHHGKSSLAFVCAYYYTNFPEGAEPYPLPALGGSRKKPSTKAFIYGTLSGVVGAP